VNELGPIETRRRTGTEVFRAGEEPIGFDLLSFWQWSASDVVSNATRGVLAEYLVAQALGIADGGVREEWAAYDPKSRNGVRIDVIGAGIKDCAL
jgi:hypothetical protein